MNKSQITPAFRFEIIEDDICIGHAQPIDSPAIQCDADADVKLSLSGTLCWILRHQIGSRYLSSLI